MKGKGKGKGTAKPDEPAALPTHREIQSATRLVQKQWGVVAMHWTELLALAKKKRLPIAGCVALVPKTAFLMVCDAVGRTMAPVAVVMSENPNKIFSKGHFPCVERRLQLDVMEDSTRCVVWSDRFIVQLSDNLDARVDMRVDDDAILIEDDGNQGDRRIDLILDFHGWSRSDLTPKQITAMLTSDAFEVPEDDIKGITVREGGQYPNARVVFSGRDIAIAMLERSGTNSIYAKVACVLCSSNIIWKLIRHI